MLAYLHLANLRQLLSNMRGIAQVLADDLRMMSLLLRIAAILAAIALVFAGSGHGLLVFAPALALYLLACLGLAGLSLWRLRPAGHGTLWIALDALFVTVILYEHIIGAPVTGPHGLTTASLVIPFLFLSHVGMTLQARLIGLFSGLVLSGWTGMLAVMAWRHEQLARGAFWDVFLSLDFGLVLTFGLTALSSYLLALDHQRTRREARRIDRWRHNLARFFSPLVVADLQEDGHRLALQRRPAAIMFVDLRDFTSYAEHAPPAELAQVLTGYRQLVAGTVFAHGGTVDKFMGDGVMAVFGQPAAKDDDAERALRCAVALSEKLLAWRSVAGSGAFEAGIGLHYGMVIGGVLDSGSHDEFTVFGDAVNVARRLESLSKALGATVVVSLALLGRVPKGRRSGGWTVKKGVSLSGRRIPLDIAYRPRWREPARLRTAIDAPSLSSNLRQGLIEPDAR
ncbi:adenylate/guanylate cyclase domain-containing protein [Mesorhizobium australicum]|uniref:Adenylate cyclase n=1 Tax=Mesorhizobium australicum TaxID=536018 RepID=A0A1X7MMX6_9HYPH|nr:adenylate/guanylate cyclase domain-containing protein [Mesorhizobium australicum]SMH26170.1 adenylate cyclase [Mesorhizobium australicum]